MYWFYAVDEGYNSETDDAVHVRITNWQPDNTTSSQSSAALGVSSLVGIGLLVVMAYLFKMQTDKIEPTKKKHDVSAVHSSNPMLEVQMGTVATTIESHRDIETAKDV